MRVDLDKENFTAYAIDKITTNDVDDAVSIDPNLTEGEQFFSKLFFVFSQRNRVKVSKIETYKTLKNGKFNRKTKMTYLKTC